MVHCFVVCSIVSKQIREDLVRAPYHPYSVGDTGDSEKNPSSPNRSRTYDLLVSSPDALPLSYRRLVGAKAIKLGSCDKRLAYY